MFEVEIGKLHDSQVNTIPSGGYGNLLKLPLGVHQAVKKRSEFLDPETFEPITDPLPVLQNVRLITVDDIRRLGISATYSMPEVSTGMQLNQPGLERMVERWPIVKRFEEDPAWVTYSHWIGLASNYLVFEGGWERFIEVSKRDTARWKPENMDRLRNGLAAWYILVLL